MLRKSGISLVALGGGFIAMGIIFPTAFLSLLPDQSDYDVVVRDGTRMPGVVVRSAVARNIQINKAHPTEVDIESTDGTLIVADFLAKPGYEVKVGDPVIVAVLAGKAYPVDLRPIDAAGGVWWIGGIFVLMGAVMVVAGVLTLGWQRRSARAAASTRPI